MKNWHLEIWVNGEYARNAEIVAVHHTEYLEPPAAEPAFTLNELEIILEYIKSNFPEGWVISNGEITPYKAAT